MSNIAVHRGVFNGFWVFATLKVSWRQVLWNLSVNNISFIWLSLIPFGIRSQICFLILPGGGRQYQKTTLAWNPIHFCASIKKSNCFLYKCQWYLTVIKINLTRHGKHRRTYCSLLTHKDQLSMFNHCSTVHTVQNRHHHHLIECNLFSPWYRWTFDHLIAVKQKSLEM